MTNTEFDIIDELYFVNTFEGLQQELQMEELELKTALLQLLEKGWIKCMWLNTEESIADFHNFEKEYKKYHYLATKTGLLKHNSQ